MPARCCSADKSDARFKRVPRLVRLLANFQMTDAQWDSLMIPINMAFFFRSSPEARVVAMYPSPAGATESLLSLEAWNEIAARQPGARADGVGRRGAAGESHRARSRLHRTPSITCLPIDQCFKLVGLIRSQWRGFSGGTEVWQQIADYFAELRRNATVVGGAGQCLSFNSRSKASKSNRLPCAATGFQAASDECQSR